MPGPGPVESSGGGWTPETLLAHLTSAMQQIEERIAAIIAGNDRRYEQRFEGQEKAVEAALRAAKEANAKAEAASDKRFEGVNEFRAALGDQQRTLMPRSEAELRFVTLEKQLDDLSRAHAVTGGERRGFLNSWGLLIGGVLAIISVVLFILSFTPRAEP